MREWVSACCHTIHRMPQYTQRFLLEVSHFARREGGCECNGSSVSDLVVAQAAEGGCKSECLHAATPYTSCHNPRNVSYVRPVTLLAGRAVASTRTPASVNSLLSRLRREDARVSVYMPHHTYHATIHATCLT
jgi:hypothetical protein